MESHFDWVAHARGRQAEVHAQGVHAAARLSAKRKLARRQSGWRRRPGKQVRQYQTPAAGGLGLAASALVIAWIDGAPQLAYFGMLPGDECGDSGLRIRHT
jgi:hypothetical protein